MKYVYLNMNMSPFLTRYFDVIRAKFWFFVFRQDKLQKEERNSVINLHKLTQQWRAVMRQARAAELRNDIAILSQTFERVLDRKDSVIKVGRSASVCISHPLVCSTALKTLWQLSTLGHGSLTKWPSCPVVCKSPTLPIDFDQSLYTLLNGSTYRPWTG